MSELEEREASFLAAARRGLSSTDADRARVRLGVAGALAKGEVPEAEGAALEATGSPALLKVAIGLGLAAIVGGGAYTAGHHVGFSAGVRAGRATVPRVSSTVVHEPPAARSEAALPAPSAPVSASSSRAVSARRVVPSAGPMPSSSPAVGESGLDAELRTLRRVERAQRAGNPRLALALLDELDLEQPRGQLMEERAAARAVAECQSTFGPARSVVAGRFRERYGSSVYLPRVEAACEETDPSRPGDSPAERESQR
jgi:hypothetical protein